MGVVIKEIGSVFVRKDNFQIILKEKVSELLKQGLAIGRSGINIFIYSELDFNGFYVKHARKVEGGKYTVLVKNEEEAPSISEVRELIENSLRIGKIDWKSKAMYVSLKRPYTTKIWTPSGFDEEKTSNALFFRDIKRITIKDFPKIRKELDRNEFNNFVAMWQERWTEKVEYTIDNVFFIGKILVI